MEFFVAVLILCALWEWWRRSSYHHLVAEKKGADYWRGKGGKRTQTEKMRKECFDKNRGICQLCGKQTRFKGKDAKRSIGSFFREMPLFNYGHLIDNNHGGDESPENTETHCQPCNNEVSDAMLGPDIKLLKKRKHSFYVKDEKELIRIWFPGVNNIKQFRAEKARRQKKGFDPRSISGTGYWFSQRR